MVVRLARLSTSRASTSRFLSKNGRSVESRPSNCCIALARSRSDPVNLSVNWARLLFNATNCWSSLCRALTNSARLCTTAKKSPRPSFSAVNARDRLFSVVLICLPLPASPSANDSMSVTEGALGLLGCRAEFGDDVGDALAQLVPLRRHLRALDRDHRVVGHHRTTFVGWLQLNVPRRHQGGVHDHGGRVGGHLVLVLVVKRHLHLVAGRLDLVDRTHANAHDLDFVPGIERVRRWEVGDHGVGGQLLVEPPAATNPATRASTTTSVPMTLRAGSLRISKMLSILVTSRMPLPPVPPG